MRGDNRHAFATRAVHGSCEPDPTTGAVTTPIFVLRGVKTLALRLERHCDNALVIAEALCRHPSVRRVIYPGFPPTHSTSSPALDERVRRHGDSQLAADLAGCRGVLERVRLFTLAESLGGTDSLIEHPAIMTHASVPAEQRRALGMGDNLVRLSIGIEDIDDLKADLEQALSVISRSE
jgi:cystathionine gamma-lyase